MCVGGACGAQGYESETERGVCVVGYVLCVGGGEGGGGHTRRGSARGDGGVCDTIRLSCQMAWLIGWLVG